MKLQRSRKLRGGWIIFREPAERETYRANCKHYHMGFCDKDRFCYACSDKRRRVVDTIRFGCTPNVDCPILKRWDTRHGLKIQFHGHEHYLEFEY